MSSLREITSEQNPLFRSLRRLYSSREIRKQQQFLLGGSKLIQEIMAVPDRALLKAWIFCVGNPIPELVQPIYVLPPRLFRQLDFQQVGSPLALLQLPNIPEWDGTLVPGLTLFLPFQDPTNIGTALRSAAAFQVSRVVLLAEAALPFLPKAARGAGSALFQLNFFYGPSLCQLLAEKKDNLFLLDTEGEDIARFHKPPAMGLVAGLEGRGFGGCVSSCYRKLTIPIAAQQESLNGTVAVSLALYLLRYS